MSICQIINHSELVCVLFEDITQDFQSIIHHSLFQNEIITPTTLIPFNTTTTTQPPSFCRFNFYQAKQKLRYQSPPPSSSSPPPNENVCLSSRTYTTTTQRWWMFFPWQITHFWGCLKQNLNVDTTNTLPLSKFFINIKEAKRKKYVEKRTSLLSCVLDHCENKSLEPLHCHSGGQNI